MMKHYTSNMFKHGHTLAQKNPSHINCLDFSTFKCFVRSRHDTASIACNPQQSLHAVCSDMPEIIPKSLRVIHSSRFILLLYTVIYQYR